MTTTIAPLVRCSKCPKPVERNYPTKKYADLCFSCSFWQEYVDKRFRMDIARIDGQHFVIGVEQTSGMRGHSGREFKIRFHDGRQVTTTNLWAQGEIPLHFRTDLPDNARFID